MYHSPVHYSKNTTVFYDPSVCSWYHFYDEYGLIEIGPEACGEVVPALVEIEKKVRIKELFAVGYVSYQAAPAFDAAMKTPGNALMPLLSFRLYKKAKIQPVLNDETLNTMFPSANIPVSPIEWETTPENQYKNGFDKIKLHLKKGDTYQVNYTSRFLSKYDNSLSTRCIREFSRPDGYYVNYAGQDFEVISFSPELFFRKSGYMLLSKPMKGTVKRDNDPVKDSANKKWLFESEKNRAENLMIVDMIRNDLGRIASPGSVNVEKLYGIETYSYVHQMVSSVCAHTFEPVSSVVSALFPCASITGAPKVRSMEIIADIEPEPRDIYTGSLGVLFPNGNAVFNVAIRTLWRRINDSDTMYYGAGGGIVWDSDVQEEWQEMHTKLGVVT